MAQDGSGNICVAGSSSATWNGPSSKNPSRIGAAVTFTAQVTSGDAGVPTGSMVFRDDTVEIGTIPLNAGAQASLASAGLGTGAHSITAEYPSDANFSSSVGQVTQVVGMAELYLPLVII